MWIMNPSYCASHFITFPTTVPDPDEEFQNADAEENDPGGDHAITHRYDEVIWLYFIVYLQDLGRTRE